jgi:general secretion pathway protein D
MNRIVSLLLSGTLAASALGAQETPEVTLRNDSVSVRLMNASLRAAVQALARYMDRPVILGQVGDVRVTLETPQPVPRADVRLLLRGMLETQGLMLIEEPTFYTVSASGPRAEAVAPAQPRNAVLLFVIPIRHARASDVAATVNALYGRESAFGEMGAPRTPTLSDGLRENLVPPAGTPEPGQQPALVQQEAQLAGDVTIVPDARTNSLLIRASRQDFELVRAAVQQLDIRPLQVLIQVIIAEVRRDRSLSYGLEAVLPAQTLPGRDEVVSGAIAGLGVTDLVFKVMNLTGADVNATLTAAAARGNVSILSRPLVLAVNNEAAEILVGSQRPFIQVQRALPTDAPLRDQVVQFKDVGTRLNVRPTISDDGYVTLRVSQEVNAATAEVAFDAPVISTRTIQTQLLVRDGLTAVLGGLADRQDEITRSGVPLLSSLPFVGGLFGRRVTRSSETELFVFLTPTVIRTDDDLNSVSGSVRERSSTDSATARTTRRP